MEEIKTNKYQTPITEELLSEYPKEIQEQFRDFIIQVPFIRNLISPNRQYAKDRPRDKQGRIIVDLANPHILEDMDYFRPSALHYIKYGTYTSLKPNKNPNSEYGKWLREEVRRCWSGYVRPSDGEWVTGLLYFYLNYVPMMVTEVDKDNPNSRKASRIEGFPEVWEGVYWRFHCLEQARNGGLYNDFEGGNHVAELSRRGSGKSFTLADIMAHNLILGESKESTKRVVTILTAYTKEYLAGKDGTLSKFVPIIDFLATNTQFPRRRLIDSINTMTWQMGYKDKYTGAKQGTLNMTMGVSSKDDESKLRGKRGYILFEEFGSFPRLVDIYNIVRYGLEDGDFVFGLAYLVGTAGDKDSDFHGAQELIYNPQGYNIYAIPNNWDKPNQGRPYFSFFFPSYVNRKGCYNKDGVSDVVKALLQILQKRYDAKYKTGDPKTIIKVTAEMPITPAEAIIKGGTNIFPVTDIVQRINEINSNPGFYDQVYCGTLAIKDNEVQFVPTTDQPIRFFPHKNNKNMAGALEIYEMPQKDKSGKVFDGRYILGSDPYDNDESTTTSLGSTLVLDLWTDRIVAEYTGRPPMADDYYEITRRMCIFYHGKLNYENNKKGLFGYFSKMNSVHLLTDVLDFLKDKQMVKPGSIGNTTKGTNASETVNAYARNLIAKFFLLPQVTTIKDGDQDKEVIIPNLYFIKGMALLLEASQWNSQGNFDRISAMGMLMLLREDKLILSGGKILKDYDSTQDKHNKANDDFFNRNYKSSNKNY